MKQHTIQQAVSVQGNGLHTGQSTQVRILPAPIDQGLVFFRTDLAKPQRLKADADLVSQTNRCTVLGKAGADLATIEHLMAAFYALGVDNATIEVHGPELPILDGSAAPWCALIQQAGLAEQDAPREYLQLHEALTVEDPETGASISILPAETPEVDCSVMIDFDSQILGQQYARLTSLSDFESQIAPCRTFVFLHEVLALAKAGLIKGGNLDQALVLVEKQPSPEELQALQAHFQLDNTELKITDKGLFEHQSLYFPNEPARHKLLDLLGDLFLCGARVKGKIVAFKPGHSLNNRLARLLRAKLMHQRKVGHIPRYNPSMAPVYDINRITQRLQHRFPFLLLDKVVEISDQHVVGIKNVSMNEPYFPGHFPNNPVMPGVLQIEALAQAGGIFVLHNIEDPQNWDTYFLRITEARFRHKVLPGDTLVLHLELISPIRRGLCEMRGRVYVGETLVTEAELLAQIIKRPTEKNP